MYFNNVYTFTFTHFLPSLVEVSTLYWADNAGLSIIGITAEAKRDDVAEEYDH